MHEVYGSTIQKRGFLTDILTAMGKNMQGKNKRGKKQCHFLEMHQMSDCISITV